MSANNDPSERMARSLKSIDRSLQFFQLVSSQVGGQGQVVPFARHVLLPLPAENVAKKLSYLGVDLNGIAGRTVGREIDVRRPRQRIAAADDVCPGQLDKRTLRLVGQRQRLYLRRPVGRRR